MRGRAILASGPKTRNKSPPSPGPLGGTISSCTLFTSERLSSSGRERVPGFHWVGDCRANAVRPGNALMVLATADLGVHLVVCMRTVRSGYPVVDRTDTLKLHVGLDIHTQRIA